MRVRGDGVGGELMWVHGLDAGFHENARCPEPCAAIVGDDGVGFADDRRVRNAAVIGVVEAVAEPAVFGGLNLGARKCPLQLVEKVQSARGAVSDSALVVQAGEYVVQLEENPRPSHGGVRLLVASCDRKSR